MRSSRSLVQVGLQPHGPVVHRGALRKVGDDSTLRQRHLDGDGDGPRAGLLLDHQLVEPAVLRLHRGTGDAIAIGQLGRSGRHEQVVAEDRSAGLRPDALRPTDAIGRRALGGQQLAALRRQGPQIGTVPALLADGELPQ